MENQGDQNEQQNQNQNQGGFQPQTNAGGSGSGFQNQQQGFQNMGGMQPIPNATAVLVLGILSIPGCICYGIVGLVLGIIALVLASKGKQAYELNPTLYNPSSLGNLKAGKICAIIGISLSALFLLYMIVVIIFYGTMVSSMPWETILNQ